MARKCHHDLAKVPQFPANESFVRLQLELICSAAWRSQSINCTRLINFLMREHLNHAGRENGNLMATYDQLVEYGIGRRLVHETITEAEDLGLILVERGGRRGFALSHANKFTLTFLIARYEGEHGNYYFASPTDEWKKMQKVKRAKKSKSTLRR